MSKLNRQPGAGFHRRLADLCQTAAFRCSSVAAIRTTTSSILPVIMSILAIVATDGVVRDHAPRGNPFAGS